MLECASELANSNWIILGAFGLFTVSELIGINPKLKNNSISQVIISIVKAVTRPMLKKK